MKIPTMSKCEQYEFDKVIDPLRGVYEYNGPDISQPKGVDDVGVKALGTDSTLKRRIATMKPLSELYEFVDFHIPTNGKRQGILFIGPIDDLSIVETSNILPIKVTTPSAVAYGVWYAIKHFMKPVLEEYGRIAEVRVHSQIYIDALLRKIMSLAQKSDKISMIKMAAYYIRLNQIVKLKRNGKDLKTILREEEKSLTQVGKEVVSFRKQLSKVELIPWEQAKSVENHLLLGVIRPTDAESVKSKILELGRHMSSHSEVLLVTAEDLDYTELGSLKLRKLVTERVFGKMLAYRHRAYKYLTTFLKLSLSRDVINKRFSQVESRRKKVAKEKLKSM